jgi:hypothetical protein
VPSGPRRHGVGDGCRKDSPSPDMGSGSLTPGKFFVVEILHAKSCILVHCR